MVPLVGRARPVASQDSNWLVALRLYTIRLPMITVGCSLQMLAGHVSCAICCTPLGSNLPPVCQAPLAFKLACPYVSDVSMLFSLVTY